MAPPMVSATCFGCKRAISLGFTCSLHFSSFLGLPYRILIIRLAKPQKGTTMETLGRL